MAESKFTDRVAALAGKAAATAAPLAQQAKERATELAGKTAAAAGPIAEQARVKAAQGVDVVAGSLDKATKGKYTDRIHSVAEKVETVVDGKNKPVVVDTDPELRVQNTSLKSETAPLKNEE